MSREVEPLRAVLRGFLDWRVGVNRAGFGLGLRTFVQERAAEMVGVQATASGWCLRRPCHGRPGRLREPPRPRRMESDPPELGLTCL